MVKTVRQRQGRWAEQRALRLLSRRGWRLICRNWSCRWGELDLVMAKPGRLLLVEVKGRSQGSRDGGGLAALHCRKRLKLRRAWACWQLAHPQWAGVTVEQVAALVPLPPSRKRVRWLRIENP